MKEQERRPLGIIMAIIASGLWGFWCALAVFVLSSPRGKAMTAVMAVLMCVLVRGIVIGRRWARWTALSFLAALGLTQGAVVIRIAVSSLRPTGPNPISSFPIPLVIPLLFALFCLMGASLLLRRKEADYFNKTKGEEPPTTSSTATNEPAAGGPI